MPLPWQPAIDYSYPTPENPPRGGKEPHKFDENGYCIAQPPPVTPATTVVRLNFDAKVKFQRREEWKKCLLEISQEEGWANTWIGRAVVWPHRVVLMIDWEDEAPEAIRSHCVPEKHSIFSFATIRHLLTWDPDLATLGRIHRSSSPSVKELIIMRGPPDVLTPSLMDGLDHVQEMRNPMYYGDWQDFIDWKGGWAINNEAETERRQIIELSWVDREKESAFKNQEFLWGCVRVHPYEEYIAAPMRDLRKNGAVIEQMDVDYELWKVPSCSPVRRILSRINWNSQE